MTDDRTHCAKKTLRAAAASIRREAFQSHGLNASLALAALAPVLDIPARAVVAGYWPLGDEIDPLPLLRDLAGRGCILALPVVTETGQPLDFRQWNLDEGLEPGPHGTRHPLAPAPSVIPSVVLVPLLAFDLRGFRLGYGGGYYDRTLARLRQGGGVAAIGLAFAAQEVEEVPAGPWDQRLDRIATEQGMIVTGEQGVIVTGRT
ncbi:MAG: 5-formyltetrahydrofolate cyclo-ligase [Magnetospirillum sp.]|nr:5-formyltetrahydrofolate cyclo-ligase [Magnetospirillum sp.]